MLIDLTQGYGTFSTHKLFQFPDGSIKFELFVEADGSRADAVVKIRLRNHEDLFTLALVKDVLDRKYPTNRHILKIDYMMYQQDDRLFQIKESFGLKVVCKFINDMKWDEVIIFHPHSDKVEFIDKVRIVPNDTFVDHALAEIPSQYSAIWVIPDAGAFKTQMKMIQKRGHSSFLTCSKSRNATGIITSEVPVSDLNGQDCFIVDDICLGGATFLAIVTELKLKNCGKIYLIVSHGVFNRGIEHLLEHFDVIYTTNSICTYEQTDKLRVFKV